MFFLKEIEEIGGFKVLGSSLDVSVLFLLCSNLIDRRSEVLEISNYPDARELSLTSPCHWGLYSAPRAVPFSMAPVPRSLQLVLRRAPTRE